jgi:hypothetical protein
MRRHQIIACFNPAAPIAFVAHPSFASLADQINFDVPLTMACADWAKYIQIAPARLHRNAVAGMRVIWSGTQNDTLFVRH